MHAALNNRILNLVVGLVAFKMGLSLLKATHAKAILVLTSLALDPT